jgi:CHAT domain-containing protein
MVLKPVTGQLNRKRLLIVSDGALQYIPFAALPLPGAEGREDQENLRPNISTSLRSSVSTSLRPFVPLIAEHEVVSLPSASALAVLRRELAGRQPAPKRVAVLADPVFDRNDERLNASFVKADPTTRAAEMEIESDLVRSADDLGLASQAFHLTRLPFTRKEAQAILSLAPERARLAALDFAASLGTVFKPELGQYSYVHFATHGLLNSLRPELSGIVLSLVNERGADQDGFLRAHEVLGLQLSAELVVLSGCRTGLGKEINGEGLTGLTRGFMYAGAARVIASLWDVNDQTTALLMARLYRGLLGKRRLSPSAALREAQVSFWRDRRWSAPYYWAGFILQGEPR